MEKATTKTQYSIIVLSILTSTLICYYVITIAIPMLISVIHKLLQVELQDYSGCFQTLFWA
ncbi:MAG: hypothetical protein ACI86M_003479 [Saprospiraceae bacterium]|jgi:hypothetical protein